MNEGGCANCAANLKQFWCTLACSPFQTDFGVGGPVTVVDVEAGVMDGVFESCRDTTWAAEHKQTTAAAFWAANNVT